MLTDAGCGLRETPRHRHMHTRTYMGIRQSNDFVSKTECSSLIITLFYSVILIFYGKLLYFYYYCNSFLPLCVFALVAVVIHFLLSLSPTHTHTVFHLRFIYFVEITVPLHAFFSFWHNFQFSASLIRAHTCELTLN